MGESQQPLYNWNEGSKSAQELDMALEKLQ